MIVVAYEVAEGNWRLTVSDNGVGKPDGGAVRTTPGLGTSIVEALAKQLEAKVKMSKTVPHGLTVSIAHGEFPSRLSKAA